MESRMSNTAYSLVEARALADRGLRFYVCKPIAQDVVPQLEAWIPISTNGAGDVSVAPKEEVTYEIV